MKKFTLLFTLFVFFTAQLIKAQAPSDTIGAGNALQFNGNGDNYVDFGTSAFKTLNFPFSFEAWVYPTTYPSLNANIFITDLGEYYCGFESFMNLNGNVYFLFGDDQGGGQSNRFGYYSSGILPLNTWSHIAIVCTTATEVAIYINGVSQTINSDGGGASITSLIHNDSFIAAIGTTNDVNPWSGGLDEIRVWSAALSQSYIQSTMCSKIDPNTPGLIAYWRADEAETDNTLTDYTNNDINGTLQGTINRQISDAPLGNSSACIYASNYGDAQLWVNAATGDTLYAGQISGNPDGVQIYAVNSKPYDTTGLQFTPDNYFGVFCVNGIDPVYNITYHYSHNDGAVNSSNQDLATLETRTDASAASWSPLNGVLDIYNQTIVKTSQSSPQEYILNDAQMETGIEQLSVNNNQLSIYPNPSGGEINIGSKKNIDEIKVFNLLGQLVYKSPLGDLGVTQFTFELKDEGMYFVTATSGTETVTRKISIINK